MKCMYEKRVIHARARTHTHTPARTRTHIHTHTHTKLNVIIYYHTDLAVGAPFGDGSGTVYIYGGVGGEEVVRLTQVSYNIIVPNGT